MSSKKNFGAHFGSAYLCFAIGGLILHFKKLCASNTMPENAPYCSMSDPLLTNLAATFLLLKGLTYCYNSVFPSDEAPKSNTNPTFFKQNESNTTIPLPLQEKHVNLLKQQISNLYSHLSQSERNDFKKKYQEKCTEIMSQNIDDDGKYLSISAYIQQIEQIHDMTDSSIQSVSL